MVSITDLEYFLHSRKVDKTKEYTKTILLYLTNEVGPKKWIRSRDLFMYLITSGNIPNSSTIYKLLKDLTRDELIERKLGERIKHRPGRRPVYYRTTTIYEEIWFLTREELINQLTAGTVTAKRRSEDV